MRMIFFLLPALLLAPIMVYLYFYIKRSLRFWNAPVEKLWLRLLIMAACLLLGIMSANIWSSLIIVVLHLFLTVLLVDLLNLLIHKITKNAAWQKIYKSGGLPLLLMLLILGFGYWNMEHVVEKNYTVYTEKNIRSQGYRVAFISDLHFGLTMDIEELQTYGEKIASEQPDMVLLGGDIIDENTTLEEMRQALQVLGQIPSAYGTFYVYGNHDRALYSESPYFTEEQLQKALEASGIQILSDKTISISDDFTLVGREEISYRISRAPSAKLIEQVDPSDFILLLDHQPRDLEANREAGIDLQLSGHTHAGQIWPVGWISELLHFNELTYGHQQTEGFQVIVSSGMAGWGYSIRTSGHSEYLMISIQKE